jgi:hypothetical protein
MNLFDVKIGFWIAKNGICLNWKANAFVSASGFLCASFGNPSGTPEGFREDSRRIPEENKKKTRNRYDEDGNAWLE